MRLRKFMLVASLAVAFAAAPRGSTAQTAIVAPANRWREVAKFREQVEIEGAFTKCNDFFVIGRPFNADTALYVGFVLKPDRERTRTVTIVVCPLSAVCVQEVNGGNLPAPMATYTLRNGKIVSATVRVIPGQIPPCLSKLSR